MEVLIVLLVIAVLGVIVIGGIAGIVAVIQAARLRGETKALRQEALRLRADLKALNERVGEAAPAEAIVLGTPEPEQAPALAPSEPAPAPCPAPQQAAPAAHEAPLPQRLDEPAPLEAPAPAPAEAAPARGPLWLDRDWWATVERQIGQRWLVYLGGLLVFVSVGFIIKYAYDQKWITPSLVVVAGLLAGAAFVAAGDRFVRRGMRVLGLALIGAPGLPLIYLSLFAACQVYELISHEAAFAAMVLATVAGMTLAVLHDSPIVSVLSVLAGLLTPVLVSTGKDARDALFTYLLILDLGVLGVAFVRKWRSLDILAFVGTAALFAGWYGQFYQAEAMVPTLLWLGAFYVAFLVLPFAWHLRGGTPATLERFVMALVVASGAFGYAWAILHPEHPHALGWVTLGMAACYVTLGALARQRVPTDRRGLFGFAALAMLFATVTVPLHLKLHGIPLVWAAEAAALVYLGHRFAYLPVRVGGLVVLLAAVVRLFGWHWPLHDRGEAFALLLNPAFGTAAFVCLAGGACAVVHAWQRRGADGADRAMQVASAVLAGVLAQIVLHGEIGGWLAEQAGKARVLRLYASHAAGVAVWMVGSLAFVAASLHWRSATGRKVGYGCLLLSGVLLALSYDAEWKEIGGVFANARFVLAVVLTAAAAAESWSLRRWRERCGGLEQRWGALVGAAAGLLLLVVLTAELDAWLAPASAYRARLAVPILWTAGASGLMALGLWQRLRAQRAAALVALGVALWTAVRMFEPGLLDEFRLFLNGRFLVCLFLVVTVYGCGYAVRRFADRCLEDGRALPTVLVAGATFLLLVLLSADAWLYAKTALADATEARRSGQMLLSIVWSSYAVAMLVVGFWRRQRPLRLSALALFGIAAIKLGIVDLSFLKGIYRILSFLVIGLLMIGASYLYHRIEKQLKDQQAAEAADPAAP